MIVNSIPIIQKHLLFEVGAGDQVYEVKKNIQSQDDYLSGKYTLTLKALNIGKSSFLHNTYIQHLVEFGVIGLLIFLNIFYQILKYDYKNLFHKTFIQIFVFIYLLMCIPGTEFMFNQTGKFFIFIISLMLVKTSSSNANSNQNHI
jgi:O-antigen ligase